MEFKNVRFEYVKKVTLGYKETGEQGATHVIMDIASWERLLNGIAENEKKWEKEKIELKRKISKHNDEQMVYENKLIEARRDKEEADEKIRKAENLIKEANIIKQENEAMEKHLEIMAENLKRIFKERSNAARGLKPKKEHTGYCVISSTERNYRYKSNYGSYFVEEILWETILETPYTVDFTSDNIKELFNKDMFVSDENECWKIQEIGINACYFADKENDKEGKYEELINDYKWGKADEYKEYNVILEPQFKANYRTGYWEVIFYHTKPLKTVPKLWRKSK